MFDPVSFADMLSLLSIVAALALLLLGRSKRFAPQDALRLLAGIIVLASLHSFTNLLEWLNVTSTLSSVENFAQVLLPILWGILFYVFLRHGEERDLRENESRYRSLFEHSPISLWEEDASALKQWVDHLRASGVSDFRQYFEDHPDAVGECLMKMRILDVNNSTVELFGAESKAELFKGLSSVFVEGSMNTFKEELIALAESRTWFESPSILQNLQGEKLSVLLSLCIAPGYEDTWSKVFVSIIDMSQQVLAESQRDAALEMLQIKNSAIESSINAIAIAELSGNLIYVNSSFLKMWGYDDESEVLGRQAVSFWEAEEKAAEVIAALQTSGYWTGELKAQRKDSSRFPTELSASLVTDAAGQPKWMMASFVDASERVQMAEALQQSEERFRSIMQHLSDIVWLADENVVFHYETPSCSRILGYPPGYTIGRVGTELVHPDDLEEVAVEWAKVLRKVDEFVPTGVRLRHADGHWVNLEVIANNMLEHPAIRSVIVVARDVTERKRADARYFQAQKMEAIGLLAGGIAHDFNNLLTVITGFSELAQAQLEEQEVSRELIDKVLEASGQAGELVKQLLAFSRKQAIEPRILDLNATVRKLEKMLRRIIGERIELKTVLQPDLWSVKADPSQIEQVIVNLSVNARDAMPEGGILTIETANIVQEQSYTTSYLRMKPGEYTQLIVSDTGAGMSEEVQARIFEPFFTTKDLSRGTGLGLATVYSIVQQSEGHIWVYSEEGKGSVFKVYLPKAVESAILSPDVQETISLPAGTETLLVVEDDVFVRQVILTILGGLGYTVLEAGEADHALRLAREYGDRIALMLTDVIIPGKNSKELAAEISGICPHLRILFMSGYTDDTIVHQGVLDPGVAFIRKPFSQRDLAVKIREVLDENPPAKEP